MKYYLCLGILVFLSISTVIDANMKSKKRGKTKGKGSKPVVKIPINFKINQDSFVAASMLKALGVKFSMEFLLLKIQKNCKKLKVLKLVKESISRIKKFRQKSVDRGFGIAESQIKNIFGKRMRRREFRNMGINHRQARSIFGGGISTRISFSNNFDHFNSRLTKGRKGKKRKMSKLRKLCKSKGFYHAAMGRIQKIRNRILKLRREKLISEIKRTFRRILARMLGCRYVRFGKFSKILRSAQRLITYNGISLNVNKLSDMLINISSRYRPKKKSKKYNKKLMKKIFAKIISGKKLKFRTKFLIKKLATINCRAASKCYRKQNYSKKCYQVSSLCLAVKSIVKKMKAKRVGTAVTKILKQFFKKKKKGPKLF